MANQKKSIVTTNALMRHMRDSGIAISGSDQKRQLLLLGYFHGYKGYRYCKEPSNRIPYTKFSELQAVIDFDTEIKSILYRPIMQLETAFKSIATEEILRAAKSESLSVIMDRLMHAVGHKNAHDYRVQKYQARDTIHCALTSAYSSKRGNIVNHFYNADRPVPIWAIFEVLTLGQFAKFIDLLDAPVKQAMSGQIGIPLMLNTNGVLLPKMIYIVQDIRNAVAHNNMIFDSRYRGNRKVDQTIIRCIERETGISNITFDSLVDDILLIYYLLVKMEFKKRPLLASLDRIQGAYSQAFSDLGPSLYMRIFSSDARTKIQAITKYVHNA